MRKRLILLPIIILMSGNVQADSSNQIPSCYAANRLEVPAPLPQQDVFILIDETTILDDGLKTQLASISRSLVKPGASFSVLSFSAFSQGRYLNRVAGGVLELSLPKEVRSSIGVKVLKTFDSCMAGQARYGLDLALKAEKHILQNSTDELKKSDVVSSLAEVGRLVRASGAKKKTLLVVSDMLENSTISSFYAKSAVRKIDPDKELAAIARERLLGDFGGADIYVMGAGIVSEATTSVYRDPKTMGSLKAFWQGYFAKSNANLVEFGTPALLVSPQ